jgi:hypothetical protein
MKTMKPVCSILLLCLLATPAWSATNKKLSVDELRSLLTSLQQAKKSDADTALQLKQIELNEELTSSTMNTMADLVPGPLTTEQMYVLEARSSMLAPPPSDIPTAAAPDAAAQQAMLSKAQDYVAKTYSQLPPLTASRMTARFQDGIENPPNYSSVQSGITDNRDPIFEQTMLAVRLMNTKTDTVEFQNGVEKPAKDKTAWGPNGIAASIGPSLPLRTAMDQILSSGSPKWLRWESINGQQTAVYSFAVDKKKAHYAVTYCCFPVTDTTGTTHVASPIGAAPGAAPGNMQNSVEWNTFKANTGYHGELFLDPATGTVLRLILQAQFKPSDFVHYEDIRTDFAPVTVGGETLIVPIRTFTVAEIVPNGDANAARFTLRHQMVTQDFKDYQPANATAQK